VDTLIGQIPDHWRVCTLGDVCGRQPGPPAASLAATRDLDVVTPGDIEQGNIRKAPAMVRGDVPTGLRKYQLEPGDIICVRVGDPRRHARVGLQHRGWLPGSACLRLRPNEDVLSGYVSYYLDHPAVQDWLDRKSKKTAHRVISARDLGELPFALPPLESQRAIAEILGALDKKIALHRKISQTAASLRDVLIPSLLNGDGFQLGNSADC
jgi:restriction endonuclease S subunit